MLLAILTVAGCTPKSGKSGADVILPKPNSIVLEKGAVVLDKDITIEQTGCEEVAVILAETLKEKFAIENNGSGKTISLNVDEKSSILPEGYKLTIDRKGATITASTKAGAFYGAQSLIQLIAAGGSEEGVTLQYQTIEDAPRFAFRSYMLDESRHFFGEKEVLRVLDAMAAIKMNVLHWHLTDDAGWRIEIKKYPLLTEVGSKRKDTQIGGWSSDKTAGVPHEGFYTQEQIRSIVKYAKDRGIKIIPEIEMPGHASASVAAYPWLGTTHKQIEVPVKFGKHYNTYDVINPEVEEFLQNVIVEVIDLFDTDVVHIGGDEVRFNNWEEDRDMVAYKKKKGYTSFMDIQIEFTNKMSKFIEGQGVSMMGWNEILGTNLHKGEIRFDEASTKVAPNVVVQFWKGDLSQLTSAAEGGYKLVNSYHVKTYLDYSYKSIPLSSAYSFDPVPEGLAPEYHKNIYGLGCQMWTEWAPTVADIHRQTFPRLAAFAEVGWSNLDVKNYDNFLIRLAPVVAEWEKAGIVGYPLTQIFEDEKKMAEAKKQVAKK